MSTSTHFVAPEEILAFFDGELSTDRTESVAAHLDECAECRAAAESLRSNSRSLASWTVPTIPANPQFESGLSEAARRISSEQRSVSLTRFSRFFRRHWLLTAACSALFAGFVLTLSSPSRLRDHAASTARERQQDPVVTFFGNVGSPNGAKGQGILGKLQTSGDEAAPTNGAVMGGQIGGVAANSNSPFHVTTHSGKNSISFDGSLNQSQVFTNKIPLTRSATPGVAADSNGLFHGLGDQAQSSFTAPMIARTVSLAIIMKQFDTARASVDAIVAHHNGYVAAVTLSTPQGAARSLQASLRIPVPQLSAALTELRALGYVEAETQGGEEVTQQHADLVARLKISRETERRFLAILRERSGGINEVLSTEQSIARVRGEIEQMEAEQKSLEHRVDFATIDLNLAEEYKAQINSPSPSISTRLHNALVAGYRDVVETVVSIILFFAEYGPTLLLWFALLFPVGWFVRRRWLRAQGFGSSLPA
jgi:hypothetical protein